MVHLQVQVPGRDAGAVTRRIAAEGLLHLVDIAHGKIAADASPPGTRELLAAFRDLERRVRRVAERLELPLPEPTGRLESAATDFEQERQRLEGKLHPLEAETEEAARRVTEARDRVARAEQARQRSERLRAAEVPVAALPPLRFTEVRLGLAPADDLATLAAMLAPAPFAVLPLEGPGQGPCLAAVAVPASGRERLDGALRVVNFETVVVPADPAAWDQAEMARLAAEAAGDEARGREHLARLRESAPAVLADVARRVEAVALLLQAQSHFATSGRFVVISGWVPAYAAERMRRAIMAASEGRAVVEIESPDEMAEARLGMVGVPILHRNPLLLRPFQSLVRLYDTPSYREVEPTAFFALSFLVMFGLMFGDAGHGLVLFAAGYCLFRFLPRFLDYGILLMEAGTASAAFGLLYGSFFGIEGLLPVLWMEPIRDLPRFMGIALGLGVVLVSGGLLLSSVNAWRAGERGAALFSPRGLFGAFVYWVLLALAARALMPRWSVPFWLLGTLLGCALLLLGLRPLIVPRLERGAGEKRARGAPVPPWAAALESAVELVDSAFSYFANTVSFVRVAAFAAVHAGIFVALFAVADTVADLRFGGGVASVLALVVGNALAILLEGLTVSVQVLRLEYYEFFSKFFRGGGEPYRPLSRARPGKEPYDASRTETAPDAAGRGGAGRADADPGPAGHGAGGRAA
jgi:V/A-type H+-transporting ATPase subunit I